MMSPKLVSCKKVGFGAGDGSSKPLQGREPSTRSRADAVSRVCSNLLQCYSIHPHMAVSHDSELVTCVGIGYMTCL